MIICWNDVLWVGASETHELQIFDKIKHRPRMLSMVIYVARTIKEYQKLNFKNLIDIHNKDDTYIW